MASSFKPKDIRALSSQEREKKLKELELELVKARAAAAKGGSSKIRTIKRHIARIHTLTK